MKIEAALERIKGEMATLDGFVGAGGHVDAVLALLTAYEQEKAARAQAEQRVADLEQALVKAGNSLLAAHDSVKAAEKRAEAAEAQAEKPLDITRTTSCGHTWTLRHTSCPTCFGELKTKVRRLRVALDEIELAACTATPDDQAFAEILRIVREARQKADHPSQPTPIEAGDQGDG